MAAIEVDKARARTLLADSDDALDAVVCVLAAVDFLSGHVVFPEDRALAEKEGWIWFRPVD